MIANIQQRAITYSIFRADTQRPTEEDGGWFDEK